ncbi:MAG: hypothetical protein JW779_04005 [Candidatus Thorarchaeota archaeon]|nr:hypothetical protein [Candidatus Thorarchaeota archaeon]
MLKSKRRAVLLVLVLAISLLLVMQFQSMSIVFLEWEVEPGDLIQFNVTASVERDETWSRIPPRWMHLNNTTVIANVTNLPSLYILYTSGRFISEVVSPLKVSCFFENGTDLSEEDQFIESLISMALFPNGSWNELDLLFADEYEGDRFRIYTPDYRWIAYLNGNEFYFSYTGISWHSTIGWSARIDTATGIPVFIVKYDGYHDAGFYSDRIELRLSADAVDLKFQFLENNTLKSRNQENTIFEGLNESQRPRRDSISMSIK